MAEISTGGEFPLLYASENRVSEIESCLADLEVDCITPHDKVDILLVDLGLKPAAYIYFDYDTEFEDLYSHEDFRESMAIIGQTLREIGMPHLTQTKYFEYPQGRSEVEIFHVAKNLANLRELIEAAEVDIHPDHDILLGRAVGYPESAIQAFATFDYGRNPHAVLNTQDLPESIQQSEVMKFLGFRLSPTHWQEELKSVERSAQIIKEVAPRIYSEVVAD